MNRGYLFIALTAFLFSTMEIALKEIAGQFNPVQMTMTRFLVGGIALIPFALRALRRRNLILTCHDLAWFAFLGFLGIFVSMTFYQLAVENANASVVAVLFSCNPVFVLIFSALFLRFPIRRNQVVSLLFQGTGILFLINPPHTDISTAGITFTLLATALFALYAVAGTRPCIRYSGVVVTCGSFLFGSAEMLVLAAASHVPPVADFLTGHGLSLFADIPFLTGYTPGNALYMLYICMGVTGAGYAFYFMAMEATTPMTASMVFFFKPVLAPILAFIILREPIPFNMVVGILLVLAGSLVSLAAALPLARLYLPKKCRSWKMPRRPD